MLLFSFREKRNFRDRLHIMCKQAKRRQKRASYSATEKVERPRLFGPELEHVCNGPDWNGPMFVIQALFLSKANNQAQLRSLDIEKRVQLLCLIWIHIFILHGPWWDFVYCLLESFCDSVCLFLWIECPGSFFLRSLSVLSQSTLTERMKKFATNCYTYPSCESLPSSS